MSFTSKPSGQAATLAVTYLLVAAVSAVLAQSATLTEPVWLAAGVIMGALVVASPGRVPALLGGAVVAATVWALVVYRVSPVAALAFAAVEVGSAAAGAWVARRAGADTESLRGVGWLVAGALVLALVGATLGAEFWRWQLPASGWTAEWRAWAFSVLVGALLVVPLMTTFRDFRVKRSGGMPRRQFMAGAVAFVVFAVVAWVVFGRDVDDRLGSTAETLAYLPMPFLLLASLVWGARGGALAMLVGGVLVIVRTAGGGGPFAVEESFAGEAVIEVQAYVALWAMLLLAARGLAEERRVALALAQSWRLRYARTLQATGVASVEFDAVTGAATWGEGAFTVLGAEVGRIENIADWHERIDAADRPMAEAGWRNVVTGEAGVAADSYRIVLGGEPWTVDARLAAVRGPDGVVEQVAGLLRAMPVSGPGAVHG